MANMYIYAVPDDVLVADATRTLDCGCRMDYAYGVF